MLRLLKKLHKFIIQATTNDATPTLRLTRNDPNKPRVRHDRQIARMRKEPPTT
jgi:hypothetical protein